MTAPDDGYVAFDSPALEAERKVLEARPEQPAATAINAMVVDAGAFPAAPRPQAASSPGCSGPGPRWTGWAPRWRTCRCARARRGSCPTRRRPTRSPPHGPALPADTLDRGETIMAGSFAEARAQILSLQPAVLRAKAGEVRSFGSASVSAGSTLRASADRDVSGAAKTCRTGRGPATPRGVTPRGITPRGATRSG